MQTQHVAPLSCRFPTAGQYPESLLRRWGFRQCLRFTIAVMGVVDTFGHCAISTLQISKKHFAMFDLFCKNEASVNCETHKCHYVNLVSGSGSLLQTKKKLHRSLNSTPLLIFHIKTSQTLKLQVVLAKWRIQQYMVVEIQKLLFFLTCYHAQPAMLNIRFLTIHHLLVYAYALE